MAYGILLKGKANVKCEVCNGEGVQLRGYDVRTCRVCCGKGVVSRLSLAERALARQPRIYTISREHSVILRYDGYVWDEVLTALKVLTVSGIKAQLIFHI